MNDLKNVASLIGYDNEAIRCANSIRGAARYNTMETYNQIIQKLFAA